MLDNHAIAIQFNASHASDDRGLLTAFTMAWLLEGIHPIIQIQRHSIGTNTVNAIQSKLVDHPAPPNLISYSS